MIFRRRKSHGSAPSGFYRFENSRSRAGMTGYGEGDFVRLRDEYGNVWNGVADPQGDNVVRYQFRDAAGKSITGISDSFGIVLRDEKGNTWRGFVE
jgi:hypothetical protein